MDVLFVFEPPDKLRTFHSYSLSSRTQKPHGTLRPMTFTTLIIRRTKINFIVLEIFVLRKITNDLI